jgi:prepilin-type N-terminal cleavage/methylation domain-containing protein
MRAAGVYVRFHRAIRRCDVRRDEGMTLVEMMVSTALLSIVLTVFLSVMASVQRGVMRQDNMARTNTQARLAMEQLDRELRSGNVLYNPANETPAYYRLRIYTQSNADTRTPSPGYMCILWEITTGGQLRTRMWPPLQPEDATAWRVVAEGIVNRSLGVNAFQLDPDADKGGRVVNVTFVVNTSYGTASAMRTARLEAALTGRNTSYGFPGSVCTQLPT